MRLNESVNIAKVAIQGEAALCPAFQASSELMVARVRNPIALLRLKVALLDKSQNPKIRPDKKKAATTFTSRVVCIYRLA